MNASTRRVAVLGGIRIPFARQNGPYARASNQDMLIATLEALIGKRSPSRTRSSARSPPAASSSTAATST
jgi:acetyl-CoA acetyltransferase